jgi:hypothetical protein
MMGVLTEEMTLDKVGVKLLKVMSRITSELEEISDLEASGEKYIVDGVEVDFDTYTRAKELGLLDEEEILDEEVVEQNLGVLEDFLKDAIPCNEFNEDENLVVLKEPGKIEIEELVEAQSSEKVKKEIKEKLKVSLFIG